MTWRRNKLANLEGWFVESALVTDEKIDQFNRRLDELVPQRALDIDKRYAEGVDIAQLNDVAVWWSQQVLDWNEFKSIEEFIRLQAVDLLDKPALYAADVVTIEPASRIINPHVDTPHRFAQWNFDRRLLAVQFIIALNHTDSENGSTGLVDYSHFDNFPIHYCYSGLYNEYFLKNFYQPSLPKGSVLCYNSRTLHSSMPNFTNDPRSVLLIQYCESDIVDQLRSIDNIWSK